jgi:hypothetical protein
MISGGMSGPKRVALSELFDHGTQQTCVVRVIHRNAELDSIDEMTKSLVQQRRNFVVRPDGRNGVKHLIIY